MQAQTIGLLSLGLTVGFTLPAPVAAQDSALEEIIIVGVRDNRTSTGATGLALGIRNTPQSISVVDQELMQTFGADSINEALDLATGVQVERWETNRTNYTSRGFEIKSTQIDGIGLPNNWGIVTGANDAFGYEKIEIIRGANGLLTGVGSASGTINYVRKRPTNNGQGSLEVSAGSWDFRRLEGDYSTPFSSSGNWAGRVVMAVEDSDSYLHGLENQRAFVYGVVDGQLSENGTLALGYSYQDADTDGNMWGGLTFIQADGSQAEWDVDTSTGQDWSSWDTINQTAFIEYNYHLPRDWDLQLSYNYRRFEDSSKLLYPQMGSTGLDPQTGLGLEAWPGRFETDEQAHLYHAMINGSYDLLGGSHDLVLGSSFATSERPQFTYPVPGLDPTNLPPLPAFPFGGDAFPEPEWQARVLDTRVDEDLTRYYGATRLNFGIVSALLGFNAVSFEREASTLAQNLSGNELSPYYGLTVAPTEAVTLYLSYSDIYQPQDFYDQSGAFLAPTKGVNYEAGVKASWLEDRLLTTFALFSAEQRNLGVFAGMDPATGRYFYVGQDVDSAGFELEITGQVNDYLSLILGYTALELEDSQGEDSNLWIPRDSVNFAINATLPRMESLSFGLSGRWQSEISRLGAIGLPVEQDSYVLVNAFVRWDIDPQSQVQLNVNNLSDEQYISSLYEVGFYGEPRNAMLSYKYSF